MADKKLVKLEHRWVKFEGDINPITTTFKGVFDFNELVGKLKDFLIEKKFVALENGAPNEAFETMYIQKGTPKVNYLIKWEMKRDEGKYTRHFLTLDFTCRQIEETEVAWEGLKLKGHKGEISIKISGRIVPDADEKWEKHWFLKGAINFYETKIYKDELRLLKTKLEMDMANTNNIIKRFFKLMGKEPDLPLPPHI